MESQFVIQLDPNRHNGRPPTFTPLPPPGGTPSGGTTTITAPINETILPILQPVDAMPPPDNGGNGDGGDGSDWPPHVPGTEGPGTVPIYSTEQEAPSPFDFLTNIDFKKLPPWAVPAGLGVLGLIMFAR